MTIRDIERAVTKLPQQKLVAFRAWFYNFDAKAWDKQFKEDSSSGKLDKLADRAIDDFNNGHCKEL
ncbi:MAG: hypothetical protein HYY14_03810 [Candidatus Omnitrophica bacterium]|nr:hypothetical protein [Candidatus Omnitrophota bacterium]